jgi:predicted enzyme related to lactoylglutathione lyase
MITGAHFLMYSSNAEADRTFFRDVLGFSHVDVGHGWLIFGLPPSEMAVHPGDGSFVQIHAEHRLQGIVLYLMCRDLEAEMAALRARGVICAGPQQADWGRFTLLTLPSGGHVGLYQPAHELAVAL